MNPGDVKAKVEAFMESYPAGWVKEQDALAFLNTTCSLWDICIELSKMSDVESVEVILKFLQSVVHYESVSDMFTQPNFRSMVVSAVRSPSERLRKIVVDAYSVVRRESLPLETDCGLIMGLLRDDDTGVSQATSRLVVKWMGATLKSMDEKHAFIGRILAYYNQNGSNMNETDHFRFMSLFIDIGRQSPELFSLIQSQGVYTRVASQLLSNNSDLLVKLGALTFIESLAQFESGQRFLADAHVLAALEAEIVCPLADSTTVISLMYSIASILPYIRDQAQVTSILSVPSRRVPVILSTFLVSPNNAERMCAIKVLGILGRGAGTNAAVESFMRQSWKAINQMIYALYDVDVEVVNTALDATHAIVKGWERNTLMESEASQNQLTEAVLETFKRHPFPECRCLVYALLGAMIRDEEITDSALSKILSEPSPIRGALLDYKSESTYDSRRAKCDFVRVLVKMEEKGKLKRFFKKDIVEDLIDFAEQGLEWTPASKAKDEMETGAA